MSVGNRIKTLRLKKGLSQGELAEVFHVSTQAVSKWESDISYPDIVQLPAIASYFGITIDELFEYPTDLEYQRVDKLIENGKPLTNELFDKCEKFLSSELKNNPKNHRAVSTLADLYHFHACRLNDKAQYYALNALQLQPDNRFDLNTLNNALNGYINDWNISCHYKLINKLQKLIEDYPQSNQTKVFLLNNLIDDYRLEEAIKLLDDSNLEKTSFYRIRIEEAKYGFDHVKQDYMKLTDCNNWELIMEVANRFAFHHFYGEAIELYEKTFEIAPKPRYTDMLASIKYLYQSIGQYDKAIEANRRELLLLKEEWNITKGELVDEIKHNIEILNGLIKK